MGAQLPKPVVSKDIERFGNEYFTCAVASMNGFRERMEDSHSVDFQPKYGFFAVFDGHMDPDCSAYMGEHFPPAVAKANPPLSDEELQDLTVNIDCEYLALNKESGSTGTFFIANIAKGDQGVSFHVQVGNVGDSRVICGRAGQAIALTTDHKPTLPDERARIVACGGDVVNARVDGNLAVSRAFGDSQYKAGPGGPRKQKVIALPEVTHIVCTTDDFMVLCCDGVFEGNFSNEQVIEFVTQQLQETNDLGMIAAAVCDAALERGSKDNITCMVVLFKDGTNNRTPSHEFIPGPFSAPHNSGFCTAYSAPGEKLGLSLGKQLQMRYEYLQRLLQRRSAELHWPVDGNVDFTTLSEDIKRSILKANKQEVDDMSADEVSTKLQDLEAGGQALIPSEIKEIRDELKTFGEDAPPSGDGYEAWFEAQAARMTDRGSEASPTGASTETGSDGATKIMVDASTFSRLIQLQQRTGGQIPLPLLLGLLQANGNSVETDQQENP